MIRRDQETTTETPLQAHIEHGDLRKPGQTQSKQPGDQDKLDPVPKALLNDYQPADKLKGLRALITGGDSGIGRSVAVAYAKEGADVAIAYADETDDAQHTKQLIEAAGRQCLTFEGDVGSSAFCQEIVEETARAFGGLDILVNNAGEQHPQKSIADISDEQLERTFRTNIFAAFYLVRAALPYLEKSRRPTVIVSTSVTAYRGSAGLVDYSATKGGLTSMVRSLAVQLAKQKIRVNAVAPGPVWTPLIPSTFPEEKVETFGEDTPLGRPGFPDELAGAYVFLASKDASYMTGQTLHINGGEIING